MQKYCRKTETDLLQEVTHLSRIAAHQVKRILSMKLIKKWLEAKLFGRQAEVVANPPRARLPRTKVDVSTDEYEVESTFTANVRGKIESVGPGKNVLVSAYSDEYEETVPNLEILDEEGPNGGPVSGFNPYDTTVLLKEDLFKSKRKSID